TKRRLASPLPLSPRDLFPGSKSSIYTISKLHVKHRAKRLKMLPSCGGHADGEHGLAADGEAEAVGVAAVGDGGGKEGAGGRQSLVGREARWMLVAGHARKVDAGGGPGDDLHGPGAGVDFGPHEPQAGKMLPRDDQKALRVAS